MDQLVERTGIHEDDVGATLAALGMARKVGNRWDIRIDHRVRQRQPIKKMGPSLDLPQLVWMPPCTEEEDPEEEIEEETD
jgi:hypothetical protein